MFRRRAGTRRHALDTVWIGGYRRSRRDLFRVERVKGERALIEECRSGHVIDVPLSVLLRLDPVRPAAVGHAAT